MSGFGAWGSTMGPAARAADGGGLAMPALDSVASEVRAWFGDYFAVFRGLAGAERSDLAALLAYYGVPLAVVADDRAETLPDRAAVLGFAETTIGRLRAAGYSGGTVDRLDIRPLNARAALIDGAFTRHGRAGEPPARIGTAYLAVRGEAGWRLAALILTAP